MKINKIIFILLIMFYSNSYSKEPSLPQSLLEKGLTQETLKDFLYQNYVRKESNLEKECIFVNPLAEKGMYTENLFEAKIEEECLKGDIDTKETTFIIKEIKNRYEEINNIKILNYFRIDDYFKGKFKFIIPFTVVQYKKNSQQEKEDAPVQEKYSYFSIMEKAKGKNILQIIESGDEEEIETAMTEYGKALAELHLTFMDDRSIPYDEKSVQNPLVLQNSFKSVIHQDPHWENVFYDYKTNAITFIDNETLANSLEKHSMILLDLIRASYYSSDRFGFCNRYNFVPEKCDNSIRFSQILLDEYIRNYPEEYQRKLVLYLKAMLPKAMQLYQLDSDAKAGWKMIIDNLTIPESSRKETILEKRKFDEFEEDEGSEEITKKQKLESGVQIME